MQESVYWRDWQRTAATVGWGFVFATSRTDSSGLVWAAHLDSVEATILILPGCEDYILDIGLIRGVLPLKFLIDPTGEIFEFWGPRGEIAELETITREIDSVGRVYSRLP